VQGDVPVATVERVQTLRGCWIDSNDPHCDVS